MRTVIQSATLTYTADLKPQLALTLTTDRKTAQEGIQGIQDALQQGKVMECTIEPKKRKRSLNANSMAWQLIGKIADVLRADKDDVYIQMLQRYGQREPDLISVVAEAAPMVYRATQNHCCEVGESKLNGKAFKHLAILRGSSTFGSREMAILIDGIISECKGLGIETEDPAQIESLLKTWEGKK